MTLAATATARAATSPNGQKVFKPLLKIGTKTTVLEQTGVRGLQGMTFPSKAEAIAYAQSVIGERLDDVWTRACARQLSAQRQMADTTAWRAEQDASARAYMQSEWEMWGGEGSLWEQASAVQGAVLRRDLQREASR